MNQTEILELKSTITEMKISLYNFNSISALEEERITKVGWGCVRLVH
jgi:hypothetical protein